MFSRACILTLVVVTVAAVPAVSDAYRAPSEEATIVETAEQAIPKEWLRPAKISEAVDNFFHEHDVVPQLWQHHLSQLEHLPALLSTLPAPKVGETKEAGNANDYVDLVLGNINSHLPAKFPLPDVGSPVNLHDCYTVGLENGAHRSMASTFVTIQNTVKFNGGFKMGPFGLHCNWKWGLFRGSATITIPNVEVELAMQLRIESGESPMLTQFLVKEIANVKANIGGVPTMNWVIANIVEGMVNDYIPSITTAMEKFVPAGVNGVFNKLVLP